MQRVVDIDVAVHKRLQTADLEGCNERELAFFGLSEAYANVVPLHHIVHLIVPELRDRCLDFGPVVSVEMEVETRRRELAVVVSVVEASAYEDVPLLD